MNVTRRIWQIPRLTAGGVSMLQSIESTYNETGSNVAQLARTRLREILIHANESCPFWRKRFAECGIIPSEVKSIVDLSGMPILSKFEVRQHIKDIRSTHFPDEQCVRSLTGGSTAAPMEFYRDKQCQEFRNANKWFYLRRMGRNFSDLSATVWGALQDLPNQQRLKSFLYNYLRNRSIVLPGNKLDAKNMHRFCQVAWYLRPVCLHGYAQSIFRLATFVRESGSNFAPLKCVSVTAEPIDPHQQAVISEVFRCPVYNIYGTREFGYIASEIPGRQGLVVNPLNVIIEIVNDIGQPAEKGESGQIIVTDLANRAMPFIRYKIEDIGQWNHASTTNDPFPSLRIVAGRETDFLRVGDRQISGASMTLITAKGISSLQYVQSIRNHVIVRYVPDNAFVSESLNEFQNKLVSVLGRHVEIEFEQVASIEPTASGKVRYVISTCAE